MGDSSSGGRTGNLNERLAVAVTNAIGSMWCAYAFAAIAIYGFPYENIHPGSVIQWGSQEFLQLVLLSVIMVGQRVQSGHLSGLHEKLDTAHEKLDRTHNHLLGRIDGNDNLYHSA